jgi:peroxiredoxin
MAIRILILSCILIASRLPVLAQPATSHAIVITVKVKSLQEGQKYYLNSTSNIAIDSCVAKHGELRFRFMPKDREPAQLLISTTPDLGGNVNDFSYPFWSDQYDILIQGDDDEHLTLQGSPLQQTFERFYQEIGPYEKEYENTLVMHGEAAAAKIHDVLRRKYVDFIAGHLTAYSGMIVLYHKALTKNISLHESDSLFQLFSSDIRSSTYGRAVNDVLTNAGRLAIGSTAPDFIQQSAVGQSVSLTGFRGKYVLLEFWSSWCGPCRTEAPALRSAYADYKSKGFEIIGVSLDVNRNTWLKSIHDDQLSWPQVSDLKGWKNEVARLYNVSAIPRNYLIDPQGRIIATGLRGDALFEKLKEVLK